MGFSYISFMELTPPAWLESTSKVEVEQQQSFEKGKVLSILCALSNKDSFEIFCLAVSGLDATTDILKSGRFTKKRYYVRLKELVELGLVHKLSGKYVHTLLGKKVYEDSIKTLERAVSSFTLPIEHLNTVAVPQKNDLASS